MELTGLLKVIEITERICPNVFIAYYLCGSQLDRSANIHSDIDLIMVVDKDIPNSEKMLFDQVYQDHYVTHNPQIGILVIDIRQRSDLPAYAKEAHHLYGSNPFKTIPLEKIEVTLNNYIQGSYRFIHKFLRDSQAQLQFPVEVPRLDEPLLGYRFEKKDYGICTKRLVSATARIAGALLAFQLGIQPKSKRDCIFKYTEHLKGEFSTFPKDTYLLLSKAWQYELPGDVESRASFSEVLQNFNKFENHFLAVIGPYMEKLRNQGCQDEWFISCEAMINYPHHPESYSFYPNIKFNN